MSWMLNLLALYLSAGVLSYDLWGNVFIGLNVVTIGINVMLIRNELGRSRR